MHCLSMPNAAWPAPTMCFCVPAEAQPGQFPWAAVLLRDSSNGAPPMQYCGASLVAPNVVMTAGKQQNQARGG